MLGELHQNAMPDANRMVHMQWGLNLMAGTNLSTHHNQVLKDFLELIASSSSILALELVCYVEVAAWPHGVLVYKLSQWI